MQILPVLALMLAPNPPVPISDAQMRDIGCVAAIGIIAHEQRSGKDTLKSYADVRESGKRWAGIVGARVMEETGQPREVVALVIKTAVEAEQAKVAQMAGPDAAAAHVRQRFDGCKAVMDAQLGAADSVTPAAIVDSTPSMPAPEPRGQSAEPDRIALYRQQLGEDLSDGLRIAYCAGIIRSTHTEIAAREGSNSRDATAMGRLARAYDAKLANLPGQDPGGAAGVEFVKQLQATETGEEQMARCIRLGESLALALPPE